MAEAAKWPEVAEAIAARIRSGEITLGDRLPRSSELAQSEGVAERTARKAVSHLERLGVLRVVPAVGTFVAQVPPSPLPQPPAEDPLRALEERIDELQRQQALTHAHLLELYDRLGQPRPGTDATTRQARRQSG